MTLGGVTDLCLCEVTEKPQISSSPLLSIKDLASVAAELEKSLASPDQDQSQVATHTGLLLCARPQREQLGFARFE